MVPFAIHINGDDEKLGYWVLAVDTDKGFLIADADKALRWVAMGGCTLLKTKNPEAVTPVMVVQPQQPGGLVVPTIKANGAS